MTEVRAVSYSEKDCGKHVSDTKKRFAWIFQIDEKSYTLELINSTLSGKKTVLLNMEQIYHQKNILNIDFDFTHMIDGHSFRISRADDKINIYEMRIDNRTFDEVKIGKNKIQKSGLAKQYSKKQSDPFAEFDDFAVQGKNKNKKNDFGDFDFDSFTKPTSTQNVKAQEKKEKNTNNSLLDFGESSKPNVIPINEFQTNVFQTNNQGGFNNFANNFKKNQTNLLDNDYNQFATNNYANRNHYLGLKEDQHSSDKYFGDGVQPTVNQNQQKSFWENFGQNNRNAGLATKKAISNAAIKVNQLKKNVKDLIGDLI